MTNLNKDLFDYKKLGNVEEIWFKSSYDGKMIHGWIVKPPNFDSSKKYPLILEIHGGPHTNYGFHFSSEVQLFAAKGYVVLYTNPRGSTSYGKEFGNLIHHNYPSQDYDDLMSGIDHLLEQFPLGNSVIHGKDHWMRVLYNGRMLTRETGANLNVVELFSIIHDCKRDNDDYDLEHGRRAAEYEIVELRKEK